MIKIAYKNINCSEVYKSINMLNPQKTKTHRHEAGSSHLCDAGAPGGHGRCLWAGWPEAAQPVSGTRRSVGWKEWDRTLRSGGNTGPLCPPSGNGPAPVSALCTPGLYPTDGTPKTVPSPLPPPALLSRPLPSHSEHQGPIQELLRWGKQACS